MKGTIVNSDRVRGPRHAGGIGLILLLAGAWLAQAQTPIDYTVSPADGTFNVPPSARVVFTFNQAMDTADTTVQFLDGSSFPFKVFPVTTAWSAGNKILTCTPTPAFPENKFVLWTLDAYAADPSVDPLSGESNGFMTGSGSGGTTGSGTNAITSFVVAKIYAYDQAGTGAPVLSPDAPYIFDATTALASNRAANAITVILPTGAISNLTQFDSTHPENFSLVTFATNNAAFEASFPSGNYSFNVQAATSNQTVAVAFPSTVTQPNAPHISNYAAAQSVDVTKPFTLTWDAFNGAAASDYIYVTVGQTFKTGQVGATNALPGTATAVTIPANTLPANTTNEVSIGFVRGVWTTNTTYATVVSRSSVTGFELITTGGGSAPLPVISNVSRSAGVLGFDVTTVAGQKLTVVSSANLSLPRAQWSVLTATNSPGTRVHITDSTAASGPPRFYAVRNGS